MDTIKWETFRGDGGSTLKVVEITRGDRRLHQYFQVFGAAALKKGPSVYR